jgi:DMSO/TMAO reductase YedYZ heme-binding membrane subunit
VSGQLWWYVARAGGIVAWTLLVASVVWGLLLSVKVRPAGTTRPWILDLHRFLGGLAVVFVAVHVAGILLDSYVQFSLVDVLVPFASSWHPLWVGWGVVTMYLLLAVEITSLLRRHLPNRIWKRVHYLSFPLMLFATIHFVVTGTDAGNPVAIVAIAGSAFMIGGLVGRRLVEALPPGSTPARVPVPAPVTPRREPQPPVASSQPLTDPFRGESRCAPSALHEGLPLPPRSPR